MLYAVTKLYVLGYQKDHNSLEFLEMYKRSTCEFRKVQISVPNGVMLPSEVMSVLIESHVQRPFLTRTRLDSGFVTSSAVHASNEV